MNGILVCGLGWVIALLIGCGATTKQRVGDVPITVPGPPSAAGSRNDGAATQPLAGIDPGFGASALLGGLEKRLTDVLGIAKVDSKVTVFQMTDGSGYVFDESSERITFLQPLAIGGPAARTYMTGKNSGWRLSESKVDHLSEKTPRDESAFAALKILSLEFDSSGYTPVHVSPDQLILKNASELRVVRRSAEAMSLFVIKEIPALVAALPEVLAAGFAPDSSFLWVATPSKVLFFGFSGDTVAMEPLTTTFVSGLAADAKINFLAISFDNQKNTAGKILLASGGKLLVSGLATENALSWETDIRPIAEQFCVNCHKGNKAAAGFLAGDPGAWQGGVRQKIIARVFLEKTMPPINTAPANNISQKQREMIRNWLTSDAAKTD